jgi:hypothetical protein
MPGGVKLSSESTIASAGTQERRGLTSGKASGAIIERVDLVGVEALGADDEDLVGVLEHLVGRPQADEIPVLLLGERLEVRGCATAWRCWEPAAGDVHCERLEVPASTWRCWACAEVLRNGGRPRALLLGPASAWR